MKAPGVRPVPVDTCGDCPFAWDGTDMGDCWRCTAVDRGNDFRPLGRVHDPKRGGFQPPPKWCPLRKADHLVKLRLP